MTWVQEHIITWENRDPSTFCGQKFLISSECVCVWHSVNFIITGPDRAITAVQYGRRILMVGWRNFISHFYIMFYDCTVVLKRPYVLISCFSAANMEDNGIHTATASTSPHAMIVHTTNNWTSFHKRLNYCEMVIIKVYEFTCCLYGSPTSRRAQSFILGLLLYSTTVGGLETQLSENGSTDKLKNEVGWKVWWSRKE